MDENPLSKDRYQNYLLVEGSDDKHVFHHLLDYHRVHSMIKTRGKSLDIIDHEGINNLLSLKTLGAYLRGSKPRRFGIIVDADTDIVARWVKLRDILKGSGYSTVPLNPRPEGTILQEEERPIVGIWLMPDNTFPGMIEHFISLLRPSNDILWPMAEDIVEKVVATDCRFPLTQKIKAQVHTWLAWQEEPGKPMGQAITKHYLYANAPPAQQFITWIRRLFNLESAP